MPLLSTIRVLIPQALIHAAIIKPAGPAPMMSTSTSSVVLLVIMIVLAWLESLRYGRRMRKMMGRKCQTPCSDKYSEPDALTDEANMRWREGSTFPKTFECVQLRPIGSYTWRVLFLRLRPEIYLSQCFTPIFLENETLDHQNSIRNYIGKSSDSRSRLTICPSIQNVEKQFGQDDLRYFTWYQLPIAVCLNGFGSLCYI